MRGTLPIVAGSVLLLGLAASVDPAEAECNVGHMFTTYNDNGSSEIHTASSFIPAGSTISDRAYGCFWSYSAGDPFNKGGNPTPYVGNDGGFRCGLAAGVASTWWILDPNEPAYIGGNTSHWNTAGTDGCITRGGDNPTATDDGLVWYTGDFGTNFDLNPGEGYFVDVNTDITYTIVGTHDPALTITFEAPGSNGSSSGYTLYAHPYHGVATTARELMDEINAWEGGEDPVVVSVQRYLSIEDGLEVYNGFPGQTDFPLTAGQAYFISVNSDVSFVPAHY